MFILFFILPFSFFLFFFLTLTLLGLHCSTQALHCDACLFSSCGMRASLVVVLNALLLWNMGSRTFRLSSCGVQSQLFHSVQDLSFLIRMEPLFPTLEGRFSTTGPRDISLMLILIIRNILYSLLIESKILSKINT